MTAIDFSKAVSINGVAAADREEAVKLACRNRIYAVLDAPTVSNIQGALLASKLSATEVQTFGSGHDWVEAMLAASRAMVLDPSLDHTVDANWPVVPAGVAELAALY